MGKKRLKSENFNQEFAEELSSNLVKFTGEAHTNQIIDLLKLGKIRIVNPETFLDKLPAWNSDIGVSAFKSTKGLEGFITKISSDIRLRADAGETDIDISSIFFFLAYYKMKYQKTEQSPGTMKDLFRAEGVASTLGASCITIRENPYILNLFLPSDLLEIANFLGLENARGYWNICGKFLNALHNAKKDNPSINLPKLNIIFTIHEDARFNQFYYLKEVFKLPSKRIKELIKNIPTLSEKSMDLIGAVSQMKCESNYPTINIYGVLEELKCISKEKKLATSQSLMHDLRNVDCYSLLNKLPIEKVFVERSSFFQTLGSQFGEVRIDCSELEKDELDFYLDAATQILLTKIRILKSAQKNVLVPIGDLPLKITLFGIRDLSTEFVALIKEKEKSLKSLYNRNIKIVLTYNGQLVSKGGGRKESKYLRVISDIHADVNADMNYVYNFENDFVLNCGDTSGDAYTTRDWILTFMRQGISVGGNHLGYNDFQPECNGPQNQHLYRSDTHPNNTVNGQKNRLRYTFQGSPTPFLSNDTWEHEGVIYIGTTLYTDFKLFGSERKRECMDYARNHMNDFKRCTFFKHIKKKDSGIVETLTPEDYLYLFKGSFGYIKNSIERYRRSNCKLPVVVMTHFAPTPYHIADKYKNDPLSAAFASDLREEIKEMPEIRLWCCGHIHNSVDFILGKCRFVSEPFGYYWENGNSVKGKDEILNYGKRISFADLKSMKPWEEILEKEIENGDVKFYEA